MRIINCQQHTPEWWEVRKGVATASEANRIVTPKGWEMSTQARAYACELIAQAFDYDYGMPSDFATTAMKNGTVMEPQARKYYTFTTGREVDRVGFCLTDCGRFGCSPDGLCGDDGGLELKHPKAATHVRWLWEGVIPAEYLPQVHWSLIVTGRKWWDFMSFYPGLPELLIRVEPNEQTEKLRTAMQAFAALVEEVRKQITGLDPAVAVGAKQEAYF